MRFSLIENSMRFACYSRKTNLHLHHGHACILRKHYYGNDHDDVGDGA